MATPTPGTFPFDQATMTAVAARAVIDSLTVEQREQVLVASLAWLIAPTQVPTRGGFGTEPGPSPFQQAFNTAVLAKAREIATGLVETSPEIDAKLRDTFAATMAKMLDDPETENIVASALVEALAKRRRPAY